MADLALVTRASQLAPETTAGTPETADILPLSFGFTPFKPMGEGRMIKPQGNKLNTTSVPVGYRWTEFSFAPDSIMDYNELVYPLCSAIKNATPTSDGTTNGKNWRFNIAKGAIDMKATYTVEQGDSVHAQRVSYAHMLSLQLNMSREDQSMGGNWRAQTLTDDFSFSGGASSTSQQVISPQSFDVRIGSSQIAAAGTKQVETATAAGTTSGAGNITVTVTAAGLTGSPVAVVVALASGDTPTVWAGKVRTALAANAAIGAFFTVGGSTTAISLTSRTAAANDATMNIAIADTGTTGITPVVTSADTTPGVAPAAVYARPFGVEVSIDNIQDALARMNSADASYITTIELAPNITIRFTTDADDAGMGYLANWVAGSTTFINVTSIGGAIAGAVPSVYSFQLQAACKIVRGYDTGERNGSATAIWELVPVYDPTWGQALQIDLTNTVASL